MTDLNNSNDILSQYGVNSPDELTNEKLNAIVSDESTDPSMVTALINHLDVNQMLAVCDTLHSLIDQRKKSHETALKITYKMITILERELKKPNLSKSEESKLREDLRQVYSDYREAEKASSKFNLLEILVCIITLVLLLIGLYRKYGKH